MWSTEYWTKLELNFFSYQLWSISGTLEHVFCFFIQKQGWLPPSWSVDGWCELVTERDRSGMISHLRIYLDLTWILKGNHDKVWGEFSLSWKLELKLTSTLWILTRQSTGSLAVTIYQSLKRWRIDLLAYSGYRAVNSLLAFSSSIKVKVSISTNISAVTRVLSRSQQSTLCRNINCRSSQVSFPSLDSNKGNIKPSQIK